MTTCERPGCDRTVVWGMTHSLGPDAQWCEQHAVRYPGYRKRAYLPAGSPQLRLSEVSAL